MAFRRSQIFNKWIFYEFKEFLKELFEMLVEQPGQQVSKEKKLPRIQAPLK